MEVVFKNPELKYMVDNIMMFQSDSVDDMWRGVLFAAYPQIDRAHFESLPMDKKSDFMHDTIHEIYEQEKNVIAEKLAKYNEHWAINKNGVEEAFSTAFRIDCHKEFNDITGNISLNPIEPRFLEKRMFDVFYKNSERGAIGVALHEIIHFVWFHVWQEHFCDDSGEYETPHLKWVFSEMVVDPIMRSDSRLRDINPYFSDGCAYSYFYKMVIDGKPILETLYSMYKKLEITSFMECGYEYCIRHESEIRTQMR